MILLETYGLELGYLKPLKLQWGEAQKHSPTISKTIIAITMYNTLSDMCIIPNVLHINGFV